MSRISFTIITDYRPLLGIFNPNKQTPNVLSAQMLRRRIFLNAYDYDIVHRSGNKMGNADFLSRFPLQNEHQNSDEAEEVLMLEMLENPVLIPEAISKMIQKDPIYSQVLSWALRGWPEKQPTEHKFRWFFQKRNEISTMKGCLLWENRTIILKAGQGTILAALHSGQPGIVRMKASARSYVWWLSIGEDCKQTVRNLGRRNIQ